jgi:hypothetical protein
VLRSYRTIIASRVITALAAIAFILPSVAPAHDIPNDLTIQAFVKPAGQHLSLLVRAPLKAMRDVDFPKRGPGYLDIARADSALREAAMLWIADNVELYEGDNRLQEARLLSARVSLQSDRSFLSYEEALSHVTGERLPDDTEIHWDQAMLDVLFEYPIRSDRSDFSIHPRLSMLGLRVTTSLRFLPADGEPRAFELHNDAGLVRLDPRWHQSALRFVESGFFHILGGIDHLLFLFCLVIPLRSLRPLVVAVTAFTVAHSITLIAAAYNLGPGGLWFPPLIETLIALSIFYMAIENILRKKVERRWMIAFGLGLIHGFGFSFALQQNLQFAGSHLLASLLSFNLGVEIGQLLILLLLVPALKFLFRFVVAERMGTIILSALVAHTGWHWMIERADRLRQFPLPPMTADSFASLMRWLMLVSIIAAAVWFARVTLGSDEVKAKISKLFAKALPTRRAEECEGDDSLSTRGMD